MEGYHSPQVDVPVRLNTNEAPDAPPDGWKQRIRGLIDSVQWQRYPDRRASELCSRIGELHGVAPERVFVANGSNEVLQSILLAYGGAGRSSLVFEPTYALHSHISRVTGTEVVERDREPDFSLDPNAAAAAVTEVEPAVTFLCSPNNPTGMVESLEVIATVSAAGEGLVVVDEAYGQFSTHTVLDPVREDDGLIVSRTFSKTWAMAGARLGYCVAAPEVTEQLWKVVLPYHLDSFKQAAGILALDYVVEMEQRVARLVEERGRLVAALREFPVEVWPSGANFVLFRPTERDGTYVWQQLVDRGVLVRNCASWPRLDGCLRVTIGLPAEDDAFLAALGEILETEPVT